MAGRIRRGRTYDPHEMPDVRVRCPSEPPPPASAAESFPIVAEGEAWDSVRFHGFSCTKQIEDSGIVSLVFEGEGDELDVCDVVDLATWIVDRTGGTVETDGSVLVRAPASRPPPSS